MMSCVMQSEQHCVMEWTELIIVISTLLLLTFYYWSTSPLNFWKSLGVAGPTPLPLVGNFKDWFLGNVSFIGIVQRICNENPHESAIGIFIRRQPALILTDLDLIKDVLIKDFTIFPDRGLKTLDKLEPLEQHLGNLEPARWRPVRNKLSAVFTSGKLRKMFYLLLECGQHLEDYLGKIADKNEAVECRDLTAKFTTDVIGTCAFGLRMNSLTDRNNEFRQMGRKIFRSDWKNYSRTLLRASTPYWLYKFLGPMITDRKITNFFTKIMKDAMDYRKENHIVKHDFIDLMMELKDNPDKVADIEITDTLLAAQLFVFFIAGFETSSITMSHALYELAQHQSIQDKLRNEINGELGKNNGQLTYECIKSMRYLDMVFKETLRKYPVATFMERKSAKKYTFNGTKLTIPAGIKIIMPIFVIHRDPRIYPNPEVFDPERFTGEAISARHPMSWLAFGNGPRNCIGARFAIYESKVGLIKILQKYKVEVCDKTQIPYLMDHRASNSILLTPKDGIYLKISRIN